MSDRIAVMHAGIVQQFATPEQIYRHPANLFVAGFIGSPPMNFLRGVDPTKLPVANLDRFARANLGVGLVAGIRPQDIRLSLTAVPGAMEGEVQMVQLLGPEKMVEVGAGGNVLAVIVDADLKVDIGQRAWLTFDADRLHLFDAKTEESVLR